MRKALPSYDFPAKQLLAKLITVKYEVREDSSTLKTQSGPSSAQNLRRLTATRRPRQSPVLMSANPPRCLKSPIDRDSCCRIYEVGSILQSLHILYSRYKHWFRSSSSSPGAAVAYV